LPVASYVKSTFYHKAAGWITNNFYSDSDLTEVNYVFIPI
jgi:hypothetical protein